MALEKGGVSLRHCVHTSAYSDVMGTAHILQEGPEYFSIFDQQEAQIGEWEKTSESFPQDGQREG